MSKLTVAGIFVVLMFSLQIVKADDARLRVVSWGGLFQKDLVESWLQPTAQRLGLKIQTEAWDGDYAALSKRIEKRLNNWDLVHVESTYVRVPGYERLFESFPGRRLDKLNDAIAKDPRLASLLKDGYAAPILEYAVLVAGRGDLIQREVATVGWPEFWDTQLIPGHRGLRDFPVGNIEAALASLGHDPVIYLYGETDPSKLHAKVEKAFGQLQKLAPTIVWWKTGDTLQQGLESGDMVLAAAWSGRALAAFRSLCPGVANPHR